MEKVGDTWTGVVTAGGTSVTDTEVVGVIPYFCPNCHLFLGELTGAVLGGTAGNFPFEEEGVGGSSPRRDMVKG